MRRLLLRLYPKPWRDRYGEEFLALLDDMGARPQPKDVASILLEAFRARLKYRRHLAAAPAESSAPPSLPPAVALLESPVLDWLPILASFLVALAVALATCPVPRNVRITGLEAIVYAAFFLLSTLGSGWLAYQITRMATGARTQQSSRVLAVLVWMPPLLAFALRNSGWAIPIALLLAVILAKLILGYQRAETADTRSSGLRFGIAVALCLDFAVVCTSTGALSQAAMLAAAALAMLIWRLAPLPVRPLGAMRIIAYTGMSFALTCASFTPYLLTRGESGSWLQAWFGEVALPSVRGKNTGNSTRRFRAVRLIPGDPKSGFVLRPPVDEDKPLIAPPPSVTQRLFGKPRAVQTKPTEPFDIPFDGVYWFYPNFRMSLPRDAGEREGNPVENGFQSNDGTPMRMEARQSISRTIDLRGFREVEVLVRNADPRPGTVWMQLIVIDNSKAKPRMQWVGTQPVIARTVADQPAVQETLRFAVSPDLRWTEFDEILLRFDLRTPRRAESAKISIERFRLIPRGI
ncbi:hypothetical protein F183_A03990 [Bryobacterales bacterium F-183]|nr:hypothetical protein F183_A03990 [Bryobacterales bacterium F-183]